MKVSPLVTNGAQQTANVDDGRSASVDRITRAKAVARGEAPVEPTQQTPAQHLQTQRRLRMKTNATPPEIFAEPAAPPAEPTLAAPTPAPVDNPDLNEPAAVVSEENKPLSPQFAALAKQRRALQVKEREIQAREEALKANPQSTMDEGQLKEMINADPLGFILERGITYDRLTQEVLKSMEGGGPALTKVEKELRSELKNLRQDFDTQKKTYSDAQVQAQEDALDQMQADADQLIAADDTYQMIRETESNQDVRRLIRRVFDETGKTISVKEALDDIENDLLEQSLKVSQIKKVQAKLVPPAPVQQTPPAYPSSGPGRQVMRTLTNRDTVSAVPDRRARAIAAAMGKKLA